MSTETLNVVKAQPGKTIELIDSNTSHDILTSLSCRVQEQGNKDKLLLDYLGTFKNKANLGTIAETINRNFAKAQA